MGASTRLRRGAALGLAGTLVLVASACTEDLGTLEGGSAAHASAINASGLIVGASSVKVTQPDGTTTNPNHAFVTRAGGTMQDIHGGTRTSSTANAVNDAGVVVGSTTNRIGSAGQRPVPFRWSATDGFRELPLPPGATRAVAVDVNNAGTILVTGGGNWLYRPATGAYEQLVDPGFGAAAAALNDREEVVGSATFVEGGPTKAVVWTAPGTIVELDPGSSEPSSASDINAAGVVVGSAAPADGEPSRYRALRWSGPTGARQDLGLGIAHAVNDRGLIVGIAYPDANTRQAMLWDPATGTAKVLPGLADRGATALCIDDGDVAVGMGDNEDNVARAIVFDRYEG